MSSSSSSSSEETVSKFRQLKDIMWIRETLEDLTAAEFALSVESETSTAGTTTLEGPSLSLSLSSSSQSSGGGGISSKSSSSSTVARKRKRAVDYEKLLGQLTTRVEDMTCEMLIEAEDMVADDGGENDNNNNNNNDDDDDEQEATAKSPTDSKPTTATTIPAAVDVGSTRLELKENKGMGRFVYSEQQREALLE